MSEAAVDGAAPAKAAPFSAPGGHVKADGQTDWVKVFLGFGGMALGQFMAIIDIQIVNASLSQIQSGIGASADEMSWVQTIYLLAEVVIIPLTAYLSKMWGTQRFYVAAAGLFILSSIATGLSTSIEMMIATRALQGIAGGAMIPAVFATAMTAFPPERRVTATVFVGLLVSLAPTIGPTLGGHLTEWLNWRWLFFINVGPGLLVMFLVGRYGNFDRADPSLSKGIDWLGLGLMTVFLLSLQYVLEEGNKDGWFDDDVILWLAVSAAITGVAFVWRELTYRQPIVSLKPFRDRNFAIGALMNGVGGASLYGGSFILPLYLAQVMRYNAAQVGTTLLVSGLTMMVSAPLSGRLMKLFDIRVPIAAGFLITAVGMGMGAHVNANWGAHEFVVMQLIRSFGMMFAVIAAQQMSVATMPDELMKDASGLVNLIRNFGGAVGLALLSTVLSHSTAAHYSELASSVNTASLQSQSLMAGLQEMMIERGVADPEGASYKAFSMMLGRQAQIMAFADAFMWLTLGCLFVAALAVFAAPAKVRTGAAGGGH